MRTMELCIRSSLVRALVAGAIVAGGGAVAAADEARAATFHVESLSADRAKEADHRDRDLVNPWGLARSAQGPWWVANNGTNTISVLGAEGMQQRFVVELPDGPSGMVAYDGDAFLIAIGHSKLPARFLVAAEDGTISAWTPGIPQPLTKSVASMKPVERLPTLASSTPQVVEFSTIVVDNGDDGAVYKGLALANTKNGPLLYATDFHNGRVDVYDGRFQQVHASGAFVDSDLPTGYAPFGIRTLEGHVYVTYAKQDKQKMDDVAGHGNGYVDEYDLNGKLTARIAQRGDLDSPWGLAIAPREYGRLAGDLLVGQFGSGHVLAYDLKQFRYDGMLKNHNDKPLTIDGLWALDFGNGAQAGHTDWLYFTAGPNDESHGLFGYIEMNEKGGS